MTDGVLIIFILGIMQLLRMAEPRAALLVHGEKNKMAFLRNRIMEELNIPCHDPPNGATVMINTSTNIPVDISRNLLKRALSPSLNPAIPTSILPHPRSSITTQGLVLVKVIIAHVKNFTSASYVGH
jgi:mRNA degradation ribonuclease J1/J2